MSGKSCFLKAVGIIVFLAHLGSFVPAEAAVVGLTDRLFSRTAGTRAAAPLQSSFMSDLSQIAAMLHGASHRCACAGSMSGSSPVGPDKHATQAPAVLTMPAAAAGSCQ